MANRFWTGGTGNWDGTTGSSAHWGTATGGVGAPASGPGSADTATFDGASGGGTVTVTGNISCQSITMGAFTGTLDFSANNNSVALSANTGLSYTGSGVRTLNMGSGTWTFTGVSNTLISGTTVTNLTLSSSSAVLVATATTASSRGISVASGTTFASLTVSANSSGGAFQVNTNGAALTFTSLAATAPNCLAFPSLVTTTVTNAMTLTGSSGSEIGLLSASPGSTATISSANSHALTWCGVRDLTFSGGGSPTASSSFDLGHNSGITITAPSTAGGISRARAFGGFS